MTPAEKRLLRGVLDMLPVPCPCQAQFPYKPGDINAHHFTCEAERARGFLAASAPKETPR